MRKITDIKQVVIGKINQWVSIIHIYETPSHIRLWCNPKTTDTTLVKDIEAWQRGDELTMYSQAELIEKLEAMIPQKTESND